jgi:hypothetical protein
LINFWRGASFVMSARLKRETGDCASACGAGGTTVVTPERVNGIGKARKDRLEGAPICEEHSRLSNRDITRREGNAS